MVTRFLPLSLRLLLSQAILAHADLKIAIRRGISRETRYVHGRNSRTEIGDAFGPQWIYIYNGDRQLQYGLDPSTRTYTVRRVEPWKPNPLLRVRESGKTIDIYRDTVDTGERRWMFGHLARHVIQSERRVPQPGSCSAGEGVRRTKTDGWYIDLPDTQGHGYVMDGGMACPNGALDRIEFHFTGPRENGIALIETQTTDSRRVTSRTKVVEWDESPLDLKTFLPPAGFHEVSSPPNRRHDGFLDTLRYRLSGLVIAAEDWLD